MDRQECLSYIEDMGHCRVRLLTSAIAFAVLSVSAQETLKPKDVRNLAKQGSSALPRLQELLRNPDLDIRIEAVKTITEVGTPGSLAPLIQATADNDPEVQIHGAVAALLFGDKVRCLLCLRGRISDREREFDATHDRNIGQIVSNVCTVMERNLSPGQNLIEHFHLVFDVLSHIRHLEIPSAALDGAGGPA